MKNCLYSLFVLLFLLAYSCKKKQELPKENSGTPVFYFKGDVDGTLLDLEAGNSNYYMYSSHYRDTNGVYVFKGNLKKDNCDSTCDYAVAILINDTKASLPTEPMFVNVALHTGQYIFNDASLPPIYYNASFTPLKAQDNAHTYQWEVSGTPLKSDKYIGKFILDANRLYHVKYGFMNGSDCDTTHENTFKVGAPIQTTVEAKRQTLQFAYDFSTTTVGEGPYTYRWNFGDGKTGSTSTAATPSYTYDGKATGYYIVRAVVKNAKNDSSISYYQINANPDKTCDANFLAEFSPIPNSRGYKSVTIIVTKPGGEVYSSKNVIQPAGSSFDVVSVDDYDANSNKEPTKRLKININCKLKSGTKEMKLNNVEAVFAMSYR